jgi:hypothetical protein
MDGLYEIVPGSVSVEIEGRVWQLCPLRLADYAEMERRLLHKTQPSSEAAPEATNGRSDEERKRVLAEAFDAVRRGARATREELQVWLRSDEGILYELWLRLRAAQPDMTLAMVEELFADRTAEISGKMAIAAQRIGEYPLGNSPSRGPTSPRPAAANRFSGAIFSAA